MPRLFTTILLGLVLASFMGACKTSDKKREELAQAEESYGGMFDRNGRIRIKVPGELNGFSPNAGLKTQALSTPILTGLNLAESSGRPVSSSGIEEIIAKCFTQDSQFVAEGWYFYAQLSSGNKVIKDYNSHEVNRCNEMQLELKTLEKNTTYEVIASFFWQSKDRQETIVWYEGKTKPFKPSDRNITLVLTKLRVDQLVDVDVEKGEKERCLFQKYLWNGQRCVDGYNAIAFAQSDLSDYAIKADVAGARKRKCLQIGDEGFAVQYDCNYKTGQRIQARLHGSQKLDRDFPPSEYGWFALQFESGKLCLQLQPDPDKGDPYLVQAECDEGTPRADQLFTLIATQAGDQGGRNSFRIMNQFDGSARCLSVPPEKGDLTGVAPLRNGAPVRLTPCNTNNPNTRTSQFIRFVDVSD